MLTGTIKSFFNEKGFGFIVGPDGDVFFHISQCDHDHEPQIGDKVSFTMGENPRTGKTQAENVRLLDDADMDYNS